MKTIDMPYYASDIINQLQNHGFEAYVVGGCVRDSLLNTNVNDWDICTSALPNDVMSVLKEYKVVPTGVSHGTVTAIKDGEIFEITTFRNDGDYADHRHPNNVSFTKDIESDLKRRDFTVNAMAYSPKTGIIDLFEGQKDLKKKKIRCVGDAKERFEEDALRIFRALRFASCLGFAIESKTKDAIISKIDLLDCIAKERIYHELQRLICGKKTAEIITDFPDVFNHIFNSNIAQNARFLSSSPPIFSLRLALLFSTENRSLINNRMKELKFDNKTLSSILFLLDNKHKKISDDNVSIKFLLSEFGREKATLLSEFLFIVDEFTQPKAEKIKQLLSNTEVITFSELSVSGKDLIENGVKPGVKIKELLNIALEAVLMDKCANSKDSLIHYISDYI